MATHICRTCGTFQDEPYRKNPSSLVAEILVWLGAAIFAAAVHWIFLAAGLAFSLWRQFSSVPGGCPKCSGSDVIPIDSPIGRELADKFKADQPAPDAAAGYDVGRGLAKAFNKKLF